MKKATHYGELTLEGASIPCAVLEDGTRVLAQRTIAKALGVKGGGQYWEKKRKDQNGALLPEFVSAKYLQDFIRPDIYIKLCNLEEYKTKKGAILVGIDATLLPEICNIWIKADQNGALSDKQFKVAVNARILLKSFANIGIIALIDEATGYQEVRKKDALRVLVEQYIIEEARIWTKEFYDEFFIELDRIYGNQPTVSRNRPRYYGKFINKYIYKSIESGIVLPELKKLLEEK